MKLVGLMSLEADKEKVRGIFKKHGVHIYSEVDIKGHTAETIKQYGFWHTERDIPIYSTLYFAILNDNIAEAIVKDKKDFFKDFDPEHPPRLFLVNVEQIS